MCYEYDWMQAVTETEETRRIKERSEQLIKPDDPAPPRPAEQPTTEEPVPA